MSVLYLAPLATFALVLARVAAMVLTAPLFGSRAIPFQLRLILALALAFVIAPMQVSDVFTFAPGVPVFVISLAAEALIGGVLGMGVAIVLAGAQIAGQLISQMSGLSLADVFDPESGAQTPVISNLLYLVGLAVFVAIGGHRLLVAALLDTYEFMPIGQAQLPDELGVLLTTLLVESFALAMRGAAPAMIGLLLATLAMGLVGRSLPQINVMTVGFGFNLAAALVLLGVSVAAIAWLFETQLNPAVETILDRLRPVT